MSESPRLNDQIWKHAEALIERVDQASRSAALSPEAFFDDVADGLRLTSGASACSLWVRDRETRTRLAGSGISVADEPSSEWFNAAHDHAAVSRWLSVHAKDPDRLAVIQLVGEGVYLGIDLRFDRCVDFQLQHHLSDLAEVIADLSTKVYLRTQFAGLRKRFEDRGDRDRLIGTLHQGIGLNESFATIASALATETSVDRVSLLRVKGSRWRLVTTSTQVKIDQRARQVRMLEQMIDAVLERRQRYWFVVGDGDPDGDRGTEVDNYLHESGCREIYIESVENHDSGEPVAAIVLERFRRSDQDSRLIQDVLDPWREPVASAVNDALDREEAPWGLVASRLASHPSRRTVGYGFLALCMIALVACIVPSTLRIPCEGRVVSSDRAGLFAPAEGVVEKVAVRNGETVRKDQALVVVRSPELQLQQQNVESALAAARARLAALLATRTGGGGVDRSSQSSAAADEKVWRTEIRGLEQQLELLGTQQAALTIRSPIDGRVDRWDLRHSLEARPVMHGQHLLDVISASGGWKVELDFPEQNIHYLLDAMRSEPCPVTLRLRSNPTQTFEGRVQRVAEVAHLTSTGQSMIRVTLPLDSKADESLRSGATVLAQIHCGQRPIGFVWFRGLIEWSRRQAWL